MAALPDNDAEFKAFGLAGECGALSLLKEYKESADVLDQFWPWREDLRDPQMAKLLRAAIDNNRNNIGPLSTPQFDDWLKENFPSG